MLSEEADKEWIMDALHDLCQPLTALQCRLFLGTYRVEGPARNAAMEEAIAEALVQCDRMIEKVRAIQERMHAEDEGAR